MFARSSLASLVASLCARRKASGASAATVARPAELRAYLADQITPDEATRLADVVITPPGVAGSIFASAS